MAQGALLLPRKTKPQQFARVNMAHPMARHLMGFWYHVGNRTTGPVLWDAVAQVPGVGATNISATMTTEGMGLACAAPTSPASYTVTRNSLAQNPNRCTVIARLRLRTAPAARCYPVYLCSTGSLNRGCAVGFDSSGFAVATELGSNGPDSTNKKAGSVNRLNEWVTIGASSAYTDLNAPAASAKGRLWENGYRIGDAATATGVNTGQVCNKLNIGRDGTTYFSTFTGDIAWVAAFSRFLTDEEHAWWHRNPYEVLEQQSNRIFFSLPSAAAAAFIARQGLTVQQAVNRASTF